MDDKNAARQIAAIFGRSCREPSNDPGLDPALDSAAEVIACIRAEARAEACGIIGELMSYDCFEAYPPYVRGRVEEFIEAVERADAAILADEPKEERGAEVGDLVAWEYMGDWHIAILDEQRRQAFSTYGVTPIVVRRRAEVERRIEEARQ